ncbi:hypothetical protein GH714_016010 [Hevea brasiliensis]|uniref:F-box protein At3g26010-like beta-propeller domain-containing protein n=1 Tax=Hevea brasiliensis TaxID=3981 RepID=A0A6A6LHD6_HEVBR|nr:hypothetical protein GH714_016010 [Hevea brasiliensis]
MTASFLSQDDGYKIVRILKNCDGSTYRDRDISKVLNLEIFSLDTGKWRNVKVSFSVRTGLHISFQRAVLYNGIMHWVHATSDQIIAYDPSKIINISDEFRLIHLPPCKGYIVRDRVLGTCGDLLRRLMVEGEYYVKQYLSVYTLRDYDAGVYGL